MFFILEEKNTIFCRGSWVVGAISEMQAACVDSSSYCAKHDQSIAWKVDFTKMHALDTAGAFFLAKLLSNLKEKGTVEYIGLSEGSLHLLSLVKSTDGAYEGAASSCKEKEKWVYCLGRFVSQRLARIYAFLVFFGELSFTVARLFSFSGRGKLVGVARVIEETGVNALSIVGLMAFLVGVVLAYQLSDQLRHYGASIFLVDVSGVAIFREFSPLITAIIVAGRTATAFTAEIGTMKISEEIAALNTMGISSFERLILPKVLGLLCVLPLLTIWSDLFGVLGSMVMAGWSAKLTAVQFLARFSEVIKLEQLLLGLVKTPVFALVIASIGCFQGLLVEGTAESIGEQTTKAAVLSIFLIIVLDASFSILFTVLGW